MGSALKHGSELLSTKKPSLRWFEKQKGEQPTWIPIQHGVPPEDPFRKTVPRTRGMSQKWLAPPLPPPPPPLPPFFGFLLNVPGNNVPPLFWGASLLNFPTGKGFHVAVASRATQLPLPGLAGVEEDATELGWLVLGAVACRVWRLNAAVETERHSGGNEVWGEHGCCWETSYFLLIVDWWEIPT